MSEQNRRAEERAESDLCIHILGPFYVDGDETYIEAPIDGQWRHITFTGNANEVDELSIDGVVIYDTALSEDEVREAYCDTRGGFADRVLSPNEIAVIHELLTNHPEIKSWRLRNNILYLVVEDDK